MLQIRFAMMVPLSPRCRPLQWPLRPCPLQYILGKILNLTFSERILNTNYQRFSPVSVFLCEVLDYFCSQGSGEKETITNDLRLESPDHVNFGSQQFNFQNLLFLSFFKGRNHLLGKFDFFSDQKKSNFNLVYLEEYLEFEAKIADSSVSELTCSVCNLVFENFDFEKYFFPFWKKNNII